MLPPMVERELRVALLRRKARQQWMRACWIAGAVCMVLMLSLIQRHHDGRNLFLFLFALGCGGVVSQGFGLTADLFSEERRNGTLGLLVLTGLTPLEIFLNKLLGAGMLAVYSLLGALPFFAIPFLAGGVSVTQFLCALAFLANGLLFCVAIGLFASVLHREGGQAHVTALILTGLLSLATPLASWVLPAFRGAFTLPREWLTLSPAYPPYLVFVNFAGGSPHLFWIGSGLTLVYSLTALLAAAVVLHYTWREGTDTLAPRGWRERWQRWTGGGDAWRRRLRWRWMSRNPFCWLAARDRRPVLFAQVFLGLGVLVWLAGCAAAGARWLRPQNAFAFSTLIHAGLNWIMAYGACRRIAEERQTGGFELLLTAPLEPRTIVEGQCRALLVQFRSAWVMVFLLDVLLCLGGLTLPGWNTGLVLCYLTAWVLLATYWFGVHLEAGSRAMWIGAWTGRAAYAALQAVRRMLWLPVWLWMVSGWNFGSRPGMGTTGMLFLLLAMLFFGALTGFAQRRSLREKLVRELRLIACAPIPARGDKRFKKWDPALIHPPGRWGEFELKPAVPARHLRRHRAHSHRALQAQG
ncbi:MAG TPA: hypothetical protein VMU04_23075 [Candidatus Acidoferrum sp.]|nr:hypothetical protein [Candidatus Acidoferrum sp.]